MTRRPATPKKVGSLPVAGRDEAKRTNEVGTATPLLACCAIGGKDITADALLTQRALVTYIVGEQAHYHFTVTKSRRLQAIERETLTKKTGEIRREAALGMTSRTAQETSPQQVLAINRGHWSIESVHHIIDWNYDEDRSRIRTGFGPENMTRLRRLAVGILKSFQKPVQSIAELMRTLSFRTRLVFDYLRMTKNSTSPAA